MKQKLLKLKKRLDAIDASDFKMDDLEEMQNEVIRIETEFEDLHDFELQMYLDKEFDEKLEKLAVGDDNYSTFYADFVEDIRAEIKLKKDDLEFFDPEAELDRMFPDRHDPDFDEDSISYDSVFGDD
jgi:hypothetical protein